MAKFLYLIVALATAASAQSTSATATPTTLPHRKIFNFLYGSSDRDDLEVDVNANAQNSDTSDSDDAAESSEDPGSVVFQPLDAAIIPPSSQQGSDYTPEVLLDTDLTNGSQDDHGQSVQREVKESIYQDPKGGASPTSVHEDDVVWVTRYSYESVTIPLPTVAPVTETDFETVTQVQTTTQFDILTATVTLAAGVTPTEDAFHQGYDQGFSAGQWNCVANATETGASGEQAYDEGYVDGAHWGYREGYRDGAGHRQFILPEFATAAPFAATPAYPAGPAYQPQPTAYPYGYGYGGGYGGYPGYGSPVQPPQAQPAPPSVNPPAPVSYTTVSYFVPYGGQPGPYYGGYQPYEQQAELAETPVAIIAAASTPTAVAAVQTSA